MLLAGATGDVVVPYSQQVVMAGMLRAANVPTKLLEVAGSRHGGKLKPLVWPQTLAFLHAHLD